MNQTIFNIELRKFLEKSPHSIPHKHFESILRSPVFEMTDEQVTAMNSKTPDYDLWPTMWRDTNVPGTPKLGDVNRFLIHMPFSYLKVRRTDGKMGDEEWHIAWQDNEGTFWLLSCVLDPNGPKNIFIIIRAEATLPYPEAYHNMSPSDVEKIKKQPGMIYQEMILQAFASSKPLVDQIPNDPVAKYAARKHSHDLNNFIIRFCYECSYSDNYITRVSPPKDECDKRPIKWVESRTHYCLLPASTLKEMQSGKHVKVRESITRAAHARRGHIRKLQSPRYRRAKGHTVWVRDCWVGPKEFMNHGDKKIYSVLID